jgi:hypothetical protein
MFLAMTSMIVTTRLPLQASISSVRGQFVTFICKGKSASGIPYEDNDSRSSISSSMITERISKSPGAAYAVPDNATVDILSAIYMHFGLIPKR